MGIHFAPDDERTDVVLFTCVETWTWEQVHQSMRLALAHAQQENTTLGCIVVNQASAFPTADLLKNARSIAQEYPLAQWVEVIVFVLRDASLIALIRAAAERLNAPTTALYFARSAAEAREIILQHRAVQRAS